MGRDEVLTSTKGHAKSLPFFDLDFRYQMMRKILCQIHMLNLGHNYVPNFAAEARCGQLCGELCAFLVTGFSEEFVIILGLELGA